VVSGCGFHLLEHPDEWVPYITPCWLMSIQDFISPNKITIKVASTQLLPASQEHDCHILDAIQQLGLYNDKQLFDINAVQLYLQITTLSDIVDAKGIQIVNDAFNGKKLSDQYFALKWLRTNSGY
jgi:hypothetical protein